MSTLAPHIVSRTFNAPLALVYKVHTEAEHIGKWFGPAGTKVLKFDMNFKVGGVNHYGIEVPGGIVMWGKQVYLEIVPMKKIVHIQSFSDEQGGLGRHPMDPNWPAEMHATTTFEEDGTGTKVTISWLPYNSDAAGEASFDKAREGMNGGFKGMFDTLEAYLKSVG